MCYQSCALHGKRLQCNSGSTYSPSNAKNNITAHTVWAFENTRHIKCMLVMVFIGFFFFFERKEEGWGGEWEKTEDLHTSFGNSEKKKSKRF